MTNKKEENPKSVDTQSDYSFGTADKIFKAAYTYERKYRNEVISTNDINLVLKNLDGAYESLKSNSLRLTRFVEPNSPQRYGLHAYNLASTFDKLCITHKINFVVKTAPLTMDPKKIEENIEIYTNLLKQDGIPEGAINQMREILLERKEPQTVDSYRKVLIGSINTVRKFKSSNFVI